MRNIVFLGGKEVGYECLSYLVEKKEALGISISAVLSNERKILNSELPSVNDLCRKHGIRILSSLDELVGLDSFDILISVQYHEILRKEHISKARQVAVNLHMAPLPEYRGCNQFSFAIIDRAREFGTTIHRMEEKIDAGDIMFERRFLIPPDCDVRMLYKKTLEESVVLFRESIGKIFSGNYSFVSQQSLSGKRGSSFHRRNEIDPLKCIDLGWEKEKILRFFRATYFPPFPPPYALVDGKKVELSPEWIQEFMRKK